MPGREPDWWYGTGPHWQAALLAPIGKLVGSIASARLGKTNAYRSRLPVICVGNFTVGGSGKTPLALLIARLVAEQGRNAWFLSRGYGGGLSGPLRVDPAIHGSDDVGDEPLLLARQAPTFISRDRRKGAEAIESAASKNAVIIMDDGLQNPVLGKDLAIAVIARDRGFGNGRVIPAGPLRAPIAAQIGLADLILLSGNGSETDPALRESLSALSGVPIVSAQTRAAENAGEFRGRRVVAYAGIANPRRFFTMLEGLGAVIVERRAFMDHHTFREAEARDLLDTARCASAELVTTEKDLARLSRTSGASSELCARSSALAIQTVIEGDDLATVKELIRKALNR